MLKRILPVTIGQSFGGHPLAIWVMIPILLIKVTMGATSMFAGQLAAQGAHKVSLDAFSPEARQLLVLALGRAGLSTVVVALFCALALVRYRAMIPVAYVLMLVEQTGRAYLMLREAAVTGKSSATVVNFVLLGLTVIGLLASLHGNSEAKGV
jgi:hypothetical protein